MTSTYQSILSAVQSEIQGLDLTGIDDANVVVMKVPTARKGALPGFPGVVIAPFGQKRELAGTNEQDDISYPVLVAYIATNGEDPTANLDRALTWHQQIEKHFINQRLTGVSSVLTCTYDPRDVFDPAKFFDGYDAGGVILRFVSRESRG